MSPWQVTKFLRVLLGVLFRVLDPQLTTEERAEFVRMRDFLDARLERMHYEGIEDDYTADQ